MALPSFVSWLFLLVLCGAIVHGASAQDQTTTSFFDEILNALDQLGFTNFTAVARQVTAYPTQAAFSQLLSDSSQNQTLFVPHNTAFADPAANFAVFEAGDTAFLSTVLLYHLVPGTWVKEDIVAGEDNIIPTNLQGLNVTGLEDDKPQVLVCGIGEDGSIEIRNQVLSTAVIDTFTSDNLIVHGINQIIGTPSTYSYLTQAQGLQQLEALRFAGGAPSLDGAQGYTLFAPLDSAFNGTQSDLVVLNPADVWNNHVIMNSTIYSPNFTTEMYTAASGFQYSFDLSNPQQSQVTVNGVTANIIRSDILAENGVVHTIDQVFWNTTDPAALASPAGGSNPESASPTPTVDGTMAGATGSGTTTTSSGTASQSSGVSGGVTRGSVMTPAAIIGIVAMGLVVISVPLIFLVTRHYRRARQGIRVRRDRFRRRPSLMPPTPVPFTTPWYSTTTAIGEEAFPLKSSRHGSEASLSLPPQASTSREKAGDQFALRELTTSPFAGQAVSGASGVPVSGATLPMLAPEVVDHIVHQVSQRIDRRPLFPPGIPPTPARGPPPGYPPSYHSPPQPRSHLRRTMA